MRKAGGIVALIAGIFGFMASIFTLSVGGVVGGLATAFDATSLESDAKEVVGVGLWAVFFSFGVIILGAVQTSVRSRTPPILLTICSLAGILSGNVFVAVCLSLAFVGGILGIFEPKTNLPKSEIIEISETKKIETTERTNLIQSTPFSINNIFKTSLSTALTALILIMIFALVWIIIPHDRENAKEGSVYSETSSSTEAVDNDLPHDQAQFLELIYSARDTYKSTSNEIAQAGVLAQRNEAIASYFKPRGGLRVFNWAGTVKSLKATNNGKGELEIEIGDDVSVTTFTDFLGTNTLLEPRSRIFLTASNLAKGERVQFSGQFVREDTGEYKINEQSFAQSGSMTRPKFGFLFEQLNRFDLDAHRVLSEKGSRSEDVPPEEVKEEKSTLSISDEELSRKQLQEFHAKELKTEHFINEVVEPELIKFQPNIYRFELCKKYVSLNPYSKIEESWLFAAQSIYEDFLVRKLMDRAVCAGVISDDFVDLRQSIEEEFPESEDAQILKVAFFSAAKNSQEQQARVEENCYLFAKSAYEAKDTYKNSPKLNQQTCEYEP